MIRWHKAKKGKRKKGKIMRRRQKGEKGKREMPLQPENPFLLLILLESETPAGWTQKGLIRG